MKERINTKSVILLTVILLPLAVAISNLAGKGEMVKLNFLDMVGVESGLAEDEGDSSQTAEAVIKEESNASEAPEITLTPKNAVIIDISGEVDSPGVYMLQDGSRIFDAVEAAGGLTKDADINYINRAEPLVDGMKIYIPSVKETGEVTAGSQQSAGVGARTFAGSSYSSLININTANSEELQRIPGVGPEKIIAYRTTHGKFSSVDELINISGIGSKTLEKMKGYITAR